MAVTAASNPFTKKRTAGIKEQEQPKKGGAWTDTEKSLFESAIVLLGWGNWLAFTDVISTRDNKQIKSHAQKWEKYHPKEKARLIEEYEARKIVEASISTGINIMAAESGDVASGGGSSSNGGGGTKKKKRVARRRGSLTKAKTPTPTTTRARRRSSAPGNIMVHQEQKLPSGGGAISKRRGSLRSSIRNSIKKSTSSTSSSAAKKSSTTPTRKMSPEKNTRMTSSLSTSSHDIISSVTARVSRVTLGEEPTTPPSNISTKCFNLMTPNAPTKQMARSEYLPQEDEEGETYDELAVLASTIYAPTSPHESTALASMVGNNVPYSPTDSSPGASSFNTTVAGQYSIGGNTCINMEDLVNELDLDLDLKSPPETPPTGKKEEAVPMKTEEGEEETIEPLPVDGRNLASMVTIPDFLVNPKWNMVDSDDEEPLSTNVAVAASGPTNTQEPPPPPLPCLHPDQTLYTSIQMHIMSPPDFNNPKEYVQTEDGLSRMAMDTGRLCRVRIKGLLTDHLDMGWWRENVYASGKGIETRHQEELVSFKKFGLERLIALTAIMLDINEWYTPNETAAAAAASFASNHAGQHFNDEDDIRHIGQLISGLWERVNLSLQRGGLAFLCNDPSTSTERMSATHTAVAILDWNSRREHSSPPPAPSLPYYVCG